MRDVGLIPGWRRSPGQNVIFKSSLQLCCGMWIKEGKTNQEAKSRYQMVKLGFGEGSKNAKKWMHLKGI